MPLSPQPKGRGGGAATDRGADAGGSRRRITQPDKNPHRDASKAFLVVSSAYCTLNNAATRVSAPLPKLREPHPLAHTAGETKPCVVDGCVATVETICAVGVPLCKLLLRWDVSRRHHALSDDVTTAGSVRRVPRGERAPARQDNRALQILGAPPETTRPPRVHVARGCCTEHTLDTAVVYEKIK